jgi:aryl-alcohol dehydrogenase-like predicted oxidoreductase
MTFGTDWGWGAPPDECAKMLNKYLDFGGNFVDTANNYTNAAWATILGQLLGGRRESIVLATKYSLSMRAGEPEETVPLPLRASRAPVRWKPTSIPGYNPDILGLM